MISEWGKTPLLQQGGSKIQGGSSPTMISDSILVLKTFLHHERGGHTLFWNHSGKMRLKWTFQPSPLRFQNGVWPQRSKGVTHPPHSKGRGGDPSLLRNYSAARDGLLVHTLVPKLKGVSPSLNVDLILHYDFRMKRDPLFSTLKKVPQQQQQQPQQQQVESLHDLSAFGRR